MIKIAPSILSADFCNLERDIQRVSSADYLHVDVMDGAFVPNITIGVPVVKSIRRCTDMFLDVHLMIEKPVRYIEAFAKAGADLLSVHLEADHPTQHRPGPGGHGGVRSEEGGGPAAHHRRRGHPPLPGGAGPGAGDDGGARLRRPGLHGVPAGHHPPGARHHRESTTPPASWRWTAASPPRPPPWWWRRGPTCWWPAPPCTARRTSPRPSRLCGCKGAGAPATLEYKILTANSLEQAEQVMNDMARAGWRTVSFTPDPFSFPAGFPVGTSYAIVLEREA